MPRRQRHRSARASASISRYASRLALDQHALDLGDGLRGIQILRADVRAVHDGVAAIETERVLQRIEPLAGRLVAAVDDPAVRGQQGRGPEKTVAVPPVARAGRRAAGAENAGSGPVDLFLFRF